jgi:hypothetical protein
VDWQRVSNVGLVNAPGDTIVAVMIGIAIVTTAYIVMGIIESGQIAQTIVALVVALVVLVVIGT